MKKAYVPAIVVSLAFVLVLSLGFSNVESPDVNKRYEREKKMLAIKYGSINISKKSAKKEKKSREEREQERLMLRYELEKLTLAIKYGDMETVRGIIENNPEVLKTRSYRDPLYYAAEYSRIEIAKYLIGKGAKVKTRTFRNAIYEACHTNDEVKIDMIKLFISAGADINQASSSPPLEIAVNCNDIDLINLFLSLGADPNLKNEDDGGTAVFFSESPKVARLLIDNGARVVDIWDGRGRTPLHSAQNPEVALLLIGEGLNVNAQDDY